MFIPPRHFLL